MNKQLFIGRIGKDVEMTRTANTSISKTTIATSDKHKDKDGNYVEETEWHNLVFFGKLAETVEKYVKKGDQIYVEGKTRHSSWEKDGVKHYRTEVIVSEVKFLSKVNSDNMASQNATPSYPASIPSPELPVDPSDDLPF